MQLSKQVYLNQRDMMRAPDLGYTGHDKKRVIKRLFTINNLLEYLAENATKLAQSKELCCDIIPTRFKPCARVAYNKKGRADLLEKQDIVD